jgi:hypothetical protein
MSAVRGEPRRDSLKTAVTPWYMQWLTATNSLRKTSPSGAGGLWRDASSPCGLHLFSGGCITGSRGKQHATDSAYVSRTRSPSPPDVTGRVISPCRSSKPAFARVLGRCAIRPSGTFPNCSQFGQCRTSVGSRGSWDCAAGTAGRADVSLASAGGGRFCPYRP